MSAGWVAAEVRSRSLVSHCIGPAGARELAGAGSLDAALGMLATSSYRDRVHPGLDLATSEHEVFASVLWNLRVLAGWSPALGASRLHVLAGAFELHNLRGDLARIEGHRESARFELGSLATISSGVAPRTIGELRDVLRRSAWGDPGAVDGSNMIIALQLSLARRIVDGVPEATAWAQTYAALVVCRLVLENAPLDGEAAITTNARAVLGPRALSAKSLEELRHAFPRAVASVLDDVASRDDLWLAEARWWTRLWDEGQDTLRRSGAGPQTVVAAAAILAADAWRVRVALEIAARDGYGIEVLDAVA
ncbi:MAG: hypothetical protein WCA31_07370 [Acidimicrobiales bacterium]